MIATLATLCGCASTTKMAYPTDWPAVARASGADCDELAGVYSNDRYRTPDPRNYAYPLVVWLAGWNWAVSTRDYTEVEISLLDAKPIVRVRRRVDKVWESVPLAGWTCRDGRLVGAPPEPVDGEGSATWHVAGTVTLARATDRSLVVHAQQRVLRQSLIFMNYEREEAWVLYPAIASAQVR